MTTKLFHKDLVKIGRYESEKGLALSQIEADFLKRGISRKDALRALKEIEYYSKKDALRAKREAEAKKLEAEKTASKGNTNAESGTKNKSSFWIYILVFLVLVGLALFYHFTRINFK